MAGLLKKSENGCNRRFARIVNPHNINNIHRLFALFVLCDLAPALFRRVPRLGPLLLVEVACVCKVAVKRRDIEAEFVRDRVMD